LWNIFLGVWAVVQAADNIKINSSRVKERRGCINEWLIPLIKRIYR